MEAADLRDGMVVLARTPRVLDTLLAGLPAEWLHRDDGPGTWSAYDIVGHLLHADLTNWLPRTRLILDHGAAHPFDAFDREAMLGWEHEPPAALVARFHDTRQATLDELTSLGLTAADMDRHGLHPALGAVTLGQLLAAWVAHDLTHLAQVSEVLAGRYRDAVGPFRANMPALDRTAAAE